MTYQTTMTTSGFGASALAALARFGAFFNSAAHAMVSNSSMQRRVDLVHALQSKTDAELTALKIERDQIVHHVFKDLYYL